MEFLVKVELVGGRVETYTTEAPDAAAAMLQAYDKYGVCGVMVSPAEVETLEEAAQTLMDVLDAYPEQLVPINRQSVSVRALRAALQSATPACPVDTAIANLDALLAERRGQFDLRAMFEQEVADRHRPEVARGLGLKNHDGSFQVSSIELEYRAWVNGFRAAERRFSPAGSTK